MKRKNPISVAGGRARAKALTKKQRAEIAAAGGKAKALKNLTKKGKHERDA